MAQQEPPSDNAYDELANPKKAVQQIEDQYVFSIKFSYAVWGITPQVAKDSMLEDLEKEDAAAFKEKMIQAFSTAPFGYPIRSRIKPNELNKLIDEPR